jgi:carbon storage regulator CsrA
MLKIESKQRLAGTRLFYLNMQSARAATQEDEVMLVLSRKAGQRIMIAEDIVIVVRAIQGDRIKIGIEAPKHIQVLRAELSSQPRAVLSRAK